MNTAQPYAGVKDDVYYLSNPKEADQPGLQFFNLVDLPFSFVVDTLLLPFEIGQGEQAEKLSENEN